ncbi:MAG TPA: hypothetical protein VHJ77_02920 [Vicinamibacterales bacterium]|jgi:pimeloyl-ACP methyl ester carboxylesterase|nr:hypothetical protein [Vicinamibacterales bacterium]
MGYSDPGPSPRTARRIAEELAKLIDRSGLDGPVVLVAAISFGLSPALLSPAVQRFIGATRFRAAGYQAAADEIIHIRESASEVRTSRRKLPIPVVVVTGARGTDATWRDLQQDQVKLSERGCQIIAEQSGHLVQIDQPQIVVNAVRAVIDETRGGKVPVCGSDASVLRPEF